MSPCLRLRRAALAAGIGLAIAVAQSQAGAAERRDGTLDYGLYLGGFKVLKMTIGLTLSKDSYDMGMRFVPNGWMGSLFPWKERSYSRGYLSRDTVRPKGAGNENFWKGKRRFITLRFENRRTIVADGRPMPATAGPLLVPEPMRRDTFDLVGAIMKISATVDRSGTCPASVRVYDGRRRYDLLVRRTGTEYFTGKGYSVYKGDTIVCRVVMRRLKGFRDPNSFPRLDEAHALNVWIGRAFPDLPPMPVRFELESPWGGLVAHLVGARYRSGGTTRALTARR